MLGRGGGEVVRWCGRVVWSGDVEVVGCGGSGGGVWCGVVWCGEMVR